MHIYKAKVSVTNDGFKYDDKEVCVKSVYPLPYKKVLLETICSIEGRFTAWRDFSYTEEITDER